MIVNKNTKGYLIRSDKPNENWTEDDCFIVDDNSILASKIQKHYPYFDFVLDEEGNLIDIITIERPINMDELKIEKIKQLKELCNQTILSGFDYNNEHYNLDYEDQINMEAIKNNLLLGLMTDCEYYPSGHPCRIYSKEEFLGLYSTGMTFKTTNIQRCKTLNEQVENATTKEEIDLIAW